MKIHNVEYDSVVDALIALSKRLGAFEARYGMSSEAFHVKFNKGQLTDSIDFVEWSNDYQHFLGLKREVEESLRHVA
jgi:hypothetical protein